MELTQIVSFSFATIMLHHYQSLSANCYSIPARLCRSSLVKLIPKNSQSIHGKCTYAWPTCLKHSCLAVSLNAALAPAVAWKSPGLVPSRPDCFIPPWEASEKVDSWPIGSVSSFKMAWPPWRRWSPCISSACAAAAALFMFMMTGGICS